MVKLVKVRSRAKPTRNRVRPSSCPPPFPVPPHFSRPPQPPLSIGTQPAARARQYKQPHSWRSRRAWAWRPVCSAPSSNGSGFMYELGEVYKRWSKEAAAKELAAERLEGAYSKSQGILKLSKEDLQRSARRGS